MILLIVLKNFPEFKHLIFKVFKFEFWFLNLKNSGANFFIRANNHTREFFEAVAAKLEHWYTPDMGKWVFKLVEPEIFEKSGPGCWKHPWTGSGTREKSGSGKVRGPPKNGRVQVGPGSGLGLHKLGVWILNFYFDGSNIKKQKFDPIKTAENRGKKAKFDREDWVGNPKFGRKWREKT